jgi:sigma-54 dependent transcriptional regulator of gfr operon
MSKGLCRLSKELVKHELITETNNLERLMDIRIITANQIAAKLQLSRNTVSQYLNELLKQQQVIQIKSRPANFVDLNAFSTHFFQPQKLIYTSIEELQTEQQQRDTVFDELIGSQQSLKDCIDRITTAMAYPPAGLPFILSGNSGVGKSYLAKITHQYCIQEQIIAPDAPFITLNCAQYFHNPELLSSYLFGYAKGSFTGATADSKGMLESADGGILFLDECHRLNAESQEKLFSFMDTGTFQRMGEGNITRHSKVRLIFATTENLQKNFLRTFLRRIPIAITVPNLNDRSPLELKLHIYHAFINESKRIKQPIKVSPWVINRLYNYHYKNNVGELKSMVQILCARVFSQHLMQTSLHVSSETIGGSALTDLLTVNEQELVTQTPITFRPDDVLTDYVKNSPSNTNRMDDLLTKFIQIGDALESQAIDVNEMKRRLAREASAFMEALIHPEEHFQDEALKYMTDTIQKLFDYLNTSLFVKIKGNAVIAIATFMYHKHNFNTAFSGTRSTRLTALLKVLKDNTNIEYQLLQSFVNLVKTKLDFRMEIPDQLVLLSYLLSLEIEDNDNEQHAIILAHGFSTASSIADVANRFLNHKIFDAFDMPLSTSVDQVKEFLLHYFQRQDCHNGLVILVDMGSLMSLPKLLKNAIPGPTLVLNNVSTQEAIFVGEMIQKKVTIDSIGRQISQNLLPDYELTYPVIKKSPMIITTCHTGIGSAKQIKKLLLNSIPEQLDYKIEAVDYNYLKKYGKQNLLFNQYSVKAIIGTNNPEIADIPFISLEQLVSSSDQTILKQLFPTVTDKTILAAINSQLIQNLSIERLLSAVTILDVKKVIHSVGEMIAQLEEVTNHQLSNNQQATLYVHISSLIERLIRNEPPLVYTPANPEERLQGLQEIKRSLNDIETGYGVIIGQGELNYLYDIIFDA